MKAHAVVSRQEWLNRADGVPGQEKEFSRLRDE